MTTATRPLSPNASRVMACLRSRPGVWHSNWELHHLAALGDLQPDAVRGITRRLVDAGLIESKTVNTTTHGKVNKYRAGVTA